MKREWFLGFLGIVLGGSVGVAELAAEPILGEESLSTPSLDATPRQGIAEAFALVQTGDLAGALKLCREAVEKNADLPPPRVILAHLLIRANKLDEVARELSRAAGETPTDPEPCLLEAALAAQAKQTAKAQSLYEDAARLLEKFQKSPKRKQQLEQRLFSGMANLSESRKDWAATQKALEEWSERDPKNPVPIERLARCLFQQNKVDGALEKLREAAKLDPTAISPEGGLARLYEAAGDREKARKWMTDALQAAPDNFKTLLTAGRWAFAAGKLDEARRHAIAAMQIDPQSLHAKELRGSIAMVEKDYESAQLIFESALRLQPENFSLVNNLTLSLIEQKDENKHKRALGYAESNVQRYPRSPEAASTYAWVLYRSGRLDDAEKALRGAAAIAKTDVDTAYVTARVLVDRERKADARELLEAALKGSGPAMFRQEALKLLEQLKP